MLEHATYELASFLRFKRSPLGGIDHLTKDTADLKIMIILKYMILTRDSWYIKNLCSRNSDNYRVKC